MTAQIPDLQDAEDMARLAAGTAAALDDLMSRHGRRLFHYLLRVLQDEGDAAEVAQETFVRIFQNRGRYNPKFRFVSWLYKIATNLARDEFRRRASHPHISIDAAPEDVGGRDNEGGTIANPSPADVLQTSERVKAIREAVAALPEDLRVPLVLFEFEDKSLAEIAEILECSAKAVEMRLYRARQLLRSRLGRLRQLI